MPLTLGSGKFDWDEFCRIADETREECKTTRLSSTDGNFVEIREYHDRVALSTSGGIYYAVTDLADAKTIANRLIQAWDNGDYSIQDAQGIKEKEFS